MTTRPDGKPTFYYAATPRELGTLVRGYRHERGWTQSQLAELSGLLPKTISAIENGSGQVLLANVMRALSALQVEVHLASHPTPVSLTPVRARRSTTRIRADVHAVEKARRENW